MPLVRIFLMDDSFAGFFDSLPEGAFIGTVAPDGTATLAANSHLRLMFGWPADTLVADVMKRLAESFARERDTLDRQWDHGDNVTTEDLRLALQRYRSFFDRLLSV